MRRSPRGTRAPPAPRKAGSGRQLSALSSELAKCGLSSDVEATIATPRRFTWAGRSAALDSEWHKTFVEKPGYLTLLSTTWFLWQFYALAYASLLMHSSGGFLAEAAWRRLTDALHPLTGGAPLVPWPDVSTPELWEWWAPAFGDGYCGAFVGYLLLLAPLHLLLGVCRELLRLRHNLSVDSSAEHLYWQRAIRAVVWLGGAGVGADDGDGGDGGGAAIDALNAAEQQDWAGAKADLAVAERSEARGSGRLPPIESGSTLPSARGASSPRNPSPLLKQGTIELKAAAARHKKSLVDKARLLKSSLPWETDGSVRRLVMREAQRVLLRPPLQLVRLLCRGGVYAVWALVLHPLLYRATSGAVLRSAAFHLIWQLGVAHACRSNEGARCAANAPRDSR